MEYVEGQSLAQKMDGKPLELREILHVGVQVADALEEAHRRRITHRDIKPANLMITPKGQVKVLDFGLAKVTRPEGEVAGSDVSTSIQTAPGRIMGTLKYMSPEQVLGKEADHRSDIFSLGAVLYEMATGRLPFAGTSSNETMDRILHGQPEAIARFNYNVPAELERITRKCLEKDRERRYQSAREVLIDLRNLKRDRPSSGSAVVAGRQERWRAVLTSRRLLAIAALAMLVVGALVYLLLFRGPPIAVPADIQSLAVLPLENLSGKSAEDYFSDGMTEALITDLGKMGALRVISRPSVMKYKGTRKPLSEIAQELKVDALVEGSVLRAANRVRITAHLIHSSTERQLWSDSYEGDLRDILALQREVARVIANEIRVKLTAQGQAHLAKAHPVNPEAYDHYLRGKILSSRPNKPDNQAAIEMLQRAVAIDPTFAAGYAVLALACVDRFFFFAPQEEKHWEAKANFAVAKAISLDPDLPEAYLAQGRLLWTHTHHFPHERAIQEFRRALDLNPNSDEGHYNLAWIYNHIGLLDEGLQEGRKAFAINPNSTRPLFQIGNSLLWQGKYQEGFDVWRSIPRQAYPEFLGSQTAWALFQIGRKEEASARIKEFLKDYPEDAGGAFAGVQAILLAAAGEERSAEDKIESAAKKKAFGHFHHTAYWIACAYAWMNKPRLAVQWLQEAAETGFPCYPLFDRDSNLDPLRNDPRFITFMDMLKKRWEHYKATLGTGPASANRVGLPSVGGTPTPGPLH
jgi:TolB-like protein/Tfp pilus assembly protein PilF